MLHPSRAGLRSDSAPESGAALVIVVVFGLGVLVVVSALLSLTTHGLRDQSQRHTRRSLQAVAQTGIAEALNEIRRNESEGPYDPGGDGVGALLTGADGKAGVAVRAPSGQLLGRYRVTVETTATSRRFLNVVAAWPDFEALGEPKADLTRTLFAARLELEPKGFTPGGQPLEISGRASGDETDPTKLKSIKVEPGAQVEILAPSLAVPAVRIGDSVYRDGLKALLPSPSWTVIGADPNNPGAPAADAATVSDAPDATGVSPQSIAALAAGLDAFAESRTPGAQNLASALIALGALGIPQGGKLKLTSRDGQPVAFSLPPGDYTVPDDVILDDGVSLTGSGNLLLHRKKLEVNHDAVLTWTGNVIVSGDASAELKVKDGGAISVTGVLAVEGAAKKAKLKVEDGSSLTVTGAALVLADAQDVRAKAERGEVVLKDRSRIVIRGLILIVGQHIHFEVGRQATLDVRGSLVFGVPGEAKKGIHKLTVKSGAQVKLIHDQDHLDAAVDTLRELTSTLFGQQSAPFSVVAVSYWEPPAAQVLAEQQAALSRGDPVGIDD